MKVSDRRRPEHYWLGDGASSSWWGQLEVYMGSSSAGGGYSAGASADPYARGHTAEDEQSHYHDDEGHSVRTACGLYHYEGDDNHENTDTE